MVASLTCSFFFDAEQLGEPRRHALDTCVLCTKPLTHDSDIFMYSGDMPFYSGECRDEKMQLNIVCARQAAKAADRRQQQYSLGAESRCGHQESRKVSAVVS